MTDKPRFIVDSDVFITAKNSYYGFGICPGFWQGLLRHYRSDQVCSIDRVRSELLAGRDTDDLVQWVKSELPAKFFLATGEDAVTTAYTEVMLWVQRSPQHFDNAKAQFATGADGWLVAFAKVHGAIVVTNEQPQPAARSRVPLPNVCEQFGVTYKDTFFMLRDLGVRFELAGAKDVETSS